MKRVGRRSRKRIAISVILCLFILGCPISLSHIGAEEFARTDDTGRFEEIYDFGAFSDDIEVTFLGTFLVAATDGIVEVQSDSTLSWISEFSGLYIRDIETDFDRDRTRNGVLAYVASDQGLSVLYSWGERRQDLELPVDAKKGIGFNPHSIALSPSGQFLYIYDPTNGVYSLDLEHAFCEVDQRFIPQLINESVISWPFDYGSPMWNLANLDCMKGTNEGIILGGKDGLLFFEKASEQWSNITVTHQTTALEVQCLSYLPSNSTIYVGTYGGIETYQIVDGDISSIGAVLLPDHEWDAIYAIEYDLYFNRLYAGSPNGVYVFFLSNDTERFYSQEEAQWDGFSVYSFGTVRSQPELLYFGTLFECFILDISAEDHQTTTTEESESTSTSTTPSGGNGPEPNKPDIWFGLSSLVVISFVIIAIVYKLYVWSRQR